MEITPITLVAGAVATTTSKQTACMVGEFQMTANLRPTHGEAKAEIAVEIAVEEVVAMVAEAEVDVVAEADMMAEADIEVIETLSSTAQTLPLSKTATKPWLP
jgi:hypothetical protein